MSYQINGNTTATADKTLETKTSSFKVVSPPAKKNLAAFR